MSPFYCSGNPEADGLHGPFVVLGARAKHHYHGLMATSSDRWSGAVHGPLIWTHFGAESGLHFGFIFGSHQIFTLNMNMQYIPPKFAHTLGWIMIVYAYVRCIPQSCSVTFFNNPGRGIGCILPQHVGDALCDIMNFHFRPSPDNDRASAGHHARSQSL